MAQQKQQQQQQQKNNFVVIDTETTGTDVNKDRIVEISVIKLTDVSLGTMTGGSAVEKASLINPEMKIPEQATKVHGITDKDVEGKPTFRQIAKSLLEFIDGIDIICYNGLTFDVPLLYNEFYRAGLKWDFRKVRIIDVCNIFKQKEQRTLTYAMRFYCNEDHANAHGATADCEATVKVLAAQLLRYEDVRNSSIEELALLSNYGKKMVDIAGKFTYDGAGEIVFNFGQHKGKPAKKQKEYLEWMTTKGDFNSDTKDVAFKLLTNVKI